MIDFVSTRTEVDEATKQNARVLAVVIATRLSFLWTPLSKEERSQRRNLDKDVLKSLHYFFDPESSFETHIDFIGGDAQTFREHLLGTHRLLEGGTFNETQRRTLQLRHRLWLANRFNTSPKD